MNSRDIKCHINLLFLLIIAICFSCKNKDNKSLPFIGQHGIKGKDTIPYKIPDFSFLNQDSLIIGNKELSKHIYIADFFYTNCPSICPKVTSQMLRIYDKYKNEHRVKLVSFALDPKRDDVSALNLYAKNIGVKNNKWYFLTGEKDRIWELAEKFFVSVAPDPNDLGEITHSGKIILIDKNGHVRGFAEGTVMDEVTEFFEEIDILLKEYSSIQ